MRCFFNQGAFYSSTPGARHALVAVDLCSGVTGCALGLATLRSSACSIACAQRSRNIQVWRRLGPPFMPDILPTRNRRGVRHWASTWCGPNPARMTSQHACLRLLSTLLTPAPDLAARDLCLLKSGYCWYCSQCPPDFVAVTSSRLGTRPRACCGAVLAAHG